MCGIVGAVGRVPGSSADLLRAVAGMAESVAHRGPDDSGHWHDDRAVLGHRRLSIVDLSPTGAQPMVSRDGRHVLVYNGELYNHQDLRRDLEAEGCVFRGRSDTETLTEAIAAWGCAAVLPRLNGIFAFAAWDRRLGILTLARDHLGIKPLYWRESERGIDFASEIRAFHRLPDWRPEVDRDAVAAFLRYGNVPAPYSIFRGVFKLEPGSRLDWMPGRPTRVERFWDPATVAGAGLADPLDPSPEAAVDALEEAIRTAVDRQRMSDVPLGAFLSGGIDSSTVVALLQSLSDRPVETFSIGFPAADYDEADAARAVARHLGTRHTEVYATPQMLLDSLPRLAGIGDEPFGDSSQLPTLLVSELARRSVKVALSGDGGDELFAGYNRHVWARRLSGRGPAVLRRAAGRMLGTVPPAAVDAVARLLPEGRRPRQLSLKVAKTAQALGAADAADMHRRLLSSMPGAERLVLSGALGGNGPIDPLAAWNGRLPADPMAAAQLLDLAVYLPDDILTKVDRASMAVSLEVRVPLLDPDLVAHAWRLPAELKLRDGVGKWILRQVLHRYVPPALVDRPKSGFAVPIADWLRGPLRDWCGDLLGPAALAGDDLLDSAGVTRLVDRHHSGLEDNAAILWNLLMLQQWRQRWLGGEDGDSAAQPAALERRAAG